MSESITQEEVKERSFDVTLMRRMLHFAKPQAWLLLIAFVLVCVLNTGDILKPLIVRSAIDQYIDPTSSRFVQLAAAEDAKLVDSLVPPGARFALDGRSYYDKTEFAHAGRVLGRSLSGTQVSFYVITPDKAAQLGAEALALYTGGASPVLFAAPGPAFAEGSFLMNVEDLQRLPAGEIERLRSPDRAGIRRLSLIFLAVVAVMLVVAYCNRLLLELVGQRVVYDIRVQLFGHIERLPFSYFDKAPSGRLTTRVTNDIAALADMYVNSLVNLAKDSLLLVGVLATMFTLNVFLTWILVGVLTAVIIITATLRIPMRDTHRMARTRLARINAFIAERLQGVRIVQLFAIEEKEKEKFDVINRDFTRIRLRLVHLNGIFRPLVAALSTFAIALLLYFGGDRILGGTLSFGTLITFTFYAAIFFRPVQELAEQFDTIQSAMASAEKIFHVMDEPEEVYTPDTFGGQLPSSFDIEFQDVHLSYNKGEEILKGISFKVEQGGSVALVGSTGAGKTSITGLVPRFYDLDSGHVLLGGMDVSTLPVAFLRHSVAFVMQDVFIFSGSVLDNIALFEEHPDEQRAAEIVDYLGMGFVKGLEGGLHYHLYERGNNLSSGQRQLISFARALYFDPKVLILDEATSNIDTESEAVIQAAIRKILKGRTSIIVAHRLSTIRTVDRILVVQKGRISESGTHEELLAKGGIYQSLYELQSLSEERT
ncbi:MAG: ABC transporter ATP-binding protein [Caldiserica bacterium]|nr:ABC transporter ATP-binding protein [Caldisericota bacterium]